MSEIGFGIALLLFDAYPVCLIRWSGAGASIPSRTSPILRTRRFGPGADRQRGAPALYQIEAEIRRNSADERRTVRQKKSRQILNDFEPWLRAKLALISQKTKLAEAIRYALSRWDGLCRFVDDGCIELDSNVVERAIRPIALNRKNALFAGSDGGAEHWAVIASLIETCKLNNVDPHAYLASTITKIVNGHPNGHLDELLPCLYPAATALKNVA
jgi:transposase